MDSELSEENFDDFSKAMDVFQLQSSISNNGIGFTPVSDDFFPSRVQGVYEAQAPIVIKGSAVKSN